MAKLIGTAGHVDHGKTTLIRALTGIDADRLPEEKRRGMTIDLGFAYVDLPEFGKVSIVDVPGHEKFLTNMLVGALGIDVAMLCVSADEAVMPQTREHFQILELLPVDQMVVALTRVDLADPETRELAALDVLDLLKGTRFESSAIVPVSAHSGEGLDELKSALVQALKRSEVGLSGGHAWYLPIDRVFTVKGHGAVVTGTLAQGSVREGDVAEILPEGLRARVRTIHVHDQLVPSSEKGKRTALNLSGVKAEELRRGQAIGAPGVLHATQVLDCRVRWLHPPKHGQRIRLSLGSEEAIGKVFLSDHDPEVAQFRLETPLAAAKDQPLIVRRYSPPNLLGGGKVLVPQAKLRRKSQLVSFVQSEDAGEAVSGIVAEGPNGITTEEVCRLQGKSPQALGDTFEKLKHEGKLLGFAGLWFTPGTFELLAQKLLQALRALHESEPVLSAHAREKALKMAGLDWQGKPLERILSHLAAEGRLRTQGTAIALPEFRPQLNARQRELLDRMIDVMLRAGVNAPNLMELSGQVHAPPKAIEDILQVGLQSGELVRVAEDHFYPVRQIDIIKAQTSSHFGQRPFTAAEFRDLFQTSRKYVIPLLEFLDSQRFTVRLGDQRVIKE